MYHRRRETSFQILVLGASVLRCLKCFGCFCFLFFLLVLCLLEMICLLEVFGFLQPRSHGLPSSLPLEGRERPRSGRSGLVPLQGKEKKGDPGNEAELPCCALLA